MSVDWQLEGGCVVVTVRSQVPFAELIETLETALRYPDLPANSCLLIDVTASEILPTLPGMEMIARTIVEAKDRLSGRVAVLVGQPVRFGRARQLEVLLAPSAMELRPFYERELALAWLAGTG